MLILIMLLRSYRHVMCLIIMCRYNQIEMNVFTEDGSLIAKDKCQQTMQSETHTEGVVYGSIPPD